MSPDAPDARSATSGSLPLPAVILAADHRARGVITLESYAHYVAALRSALGFCDGILASTQPLRDLVASGALDLVPLVRVEAAGLNHAETLIRSGEYAVRLPFPYALGGEGSGTVVDCITRETASNRSGPLTGLVR